MPAQLSETVSALTRSPLVAATASNVGLTAATGDTAVVGISALLNVLGQIIKAPPQFHQNLWLAPVLLVIGCGVAWFLIGDERQAILKGGMATWNSLLNYGAMGPRGLQILGKGSDAAPVEHAGVLTQGRPVSTSTRPDLVLHE